MSKNFVEYGRIEHKSANNDNLVVIPRKYVFSLLVGAALLSMYNGSIYQEIFIISVMQFFWYGELVKNNSEEEVIHDNIDQRLSLKIVGQDYYSNPNGTFVPVHVVDSAWDGEPLQVLYTVAI